MSVGELLMTRRISAVAVLLLECLLGLVDQAHVLDGDHRLAREGLQQIDLPRQCLAGRRPSHDERTEATPSSSMARRAFVRHRPSGPGLVVVRVVEGILHRLHAP